LISRRRVGRGCKTAGSNEKRSIRPTDEEGKKEVRRDARQSPRPNFHRTPLKPPLLIHQLQRIKVLLRRVLTLGFLRIDVEVATELVRHGSVVGFAGGGRGGGGEGGTDGFGREGTGDLGEVPEEGGAVSAEVDEGQEEKGRTYLSP